jgi:hypothetical protein
LAGSQNTTSYAGTTAFIGAKSVTLSLPVSNNNQITSFEVTGVDGKGASFTGSGNNFVVTLSSDLSYQTTVHLKINNESTDYILTISQVALSSGSWGNGGDDFTCKVNYTSDDSFKIASPKMLVVYYHEDGTYSPSGNWQRQSMKVLGTNVISLPEYQSGSHVDQISILNGKVSSNSPEDANVVAVFLISGNVASDDTTFGGVKYGGTGWYETLPNHPPYYQSQQ